MKCKYKSSMATHMQVVPKILYYSDIIWLLLKVLQVAKLYEKWKWFKNNLKNICNTDFVKQVGITIYENLISLKYYNF